MRLKRARCASIAAILAAAAAAASAEQTGWTERGGVCANQIRTIVSERFGQTVRDIEFRWFNQKSFDNQWNLSQALVYVEECPGFHFFEMNADDFRCVRQAHLGKVPNYVWYRSSGDGC